ncbi:MAG: serine protease, partial [Candidatus Angelobacter sp.]
ALLSLDKVITGTAPLSKAKDAPQDTQELLLVGFPGDGYGSTAKTVKRQFSGDTLETIVSESARKELIKSESPSLTATVVFLQGTFEHGHSGSPIFNHNGEVVGIADGGLKHGTTEDSWAMPSQELSKLENSSDPLVKMSNQRSALLFAASPLPGASPVLQCGGGSFKHLKSVGYAEVLTTADDPAGLQQLAAASPVNANSFSFEVYQDLSTGATLVLPEKTTLSVAGSICTGISPGGSITIRATLFDTQADPSGQKAALDFERGVMNLSPGWVFQQAFSYPHPLPVVGGGFSLRKDWVHYLPFPNFPQQLNFQEFDAQQFETLAGRNHLLLGVTARNNRWTPLVVQTQQACLYNPNYSPYCPQALQDYKEWIESVLSVHLSTLAGT